jgi:hypothetical protein
MMNLIDLGCQRTAQTLLLAIALALALPAQASRWGARQEYREGQREIARERREARRDILRADSPREARRAYIEGKVEIGREQIEARREIRRELRYGRWRHDSFDRRDDRVGGLIAGVVLGAIIASAARGVAPPPPSPELCWVWADASQRRGYWDRCDALSGY